MQCRYFQRANIFCLFVSLFFQWDVTFAVFHSHYFPSCLSYFAVFTYLSLNNWFLEHSFWLLWTTRMEATGWIVLLSHYYYFFLRFYLFIHDRHREREAETQAEREAGSMHREPNVGFDPGSSRSHPGPKAGAKPLRHPGIPRCLFLRPFVHVTSKHQPYFK